MHTLLIEYHVHIWQVSRSSAAVAAELFKLENNLIYFIWKFCVHSIIRYWHHAKFTTGRWIAIWALYCAGLAVLVLMHNIDDIVGTMASQITSLTIVYSTVYSGADQRRHQSSASLAFVRGIHRWPMNSPHKGPVTRKMFPFDDVIMGEMQTHPFSR